MATVKRIASTLFQSVKLFIPFYSLINNTNKMRDIAKNSGESIYGGRKRDSLKFRFDFELILPIFAGVMGLITLTLAAVGAMAILTSVSLTTALFILPNIVDLGIKQFSRLSSWLQHRNTSVINKTNPGKYTLHYDDIIDKSYNLISEMYNAKQLIENNPKSYALMSKLYAAKQEIKNNPEGWSGVSLQQQKKLNVINESVLHYQQQSPEKIQLATEGIVYGHSAITNYKKPLYVFKDPSFTSKEDEDIFETIKNSA